MRSSERGNAVIFILLAVALFAGLAYTIMRGAKSGQGNLTAGQTKLAAQKILNYAGLVEKTVNKLRTRGCSENDLSFENPYDPYHTNPAAPAECKIFDSNGGNISALQADTNWFLVANDPVFYYTQGDPIKDVGTTCTAGSCAELNLNIWAINEQLCNELNRQLGHNFTTIPTDELWGCPLDNGEYDCNGDTLVVKFTNPELEGVKAVCYNDATYGYVFNYVLMER